MLLCFKSIKQDTMPLNRAGIPFFPKYINHFEVADIF